MATPDDMPSPDKAGPGLRPEHSQLTAMAVMSQAVAGEIMLDRLIERVVAMAVHHAGAMRGVLLLCSPGLPDVAAEAVATAGCPVTSLHQPPDTAHAVPASVLEHIVRTRDAVILDDASAAGPYATDPYVRRMRPRALLCLPLIKSTQLIGALYLENHRFPSVFTPARLATLQILCAQAAIAIEHAQLLRAAEETRAKALRTEQEFRRAFDMIPTGAWRAAPDGTFEIANQQWHDYTGISHADAVAGRWVAAFHPEDITTVAAKWAELLQSGSAGEIEARMIRADGVVRRFLLRATPTRDKHGVIINWYGSNTDIEDIKRAEEAQQAFARTSRLVAIGELAVSIVHDVNQPLAAILTNAAACVRWLSGQRHNVTEARKAAECIVADVRRAGDIVASIRALARKSPATMTRLDLHEVILDTLGLLRSECQRRGIMVNTTLAPQVRFAVGDRVQLQQVILNLGMNGVEAMSMAPDQPPVLSVTCQAAQPGHIEITVADTGIGLDPDTSTRIFDAFFTTKPDGIGMGLAICRSIVEAHGGRLWVSRNTPRGSAFRFTVRQFDNGSN